MARPSSVTRLAAKVRASIGEWHQDGATLDEILDELEGQYAVKISRSALHRHVKGLEKVLQRITRSKQIAEATVKAFGKEPDSKVTRANIELMHAAIQEIMMQGDEDLPGEREGEGEGKAKHEVGVATPMNAMLIAKAIEHLTKASRHDAEFVTKVKEEARREIQAEVKAKIQNLGTMQELKEMTDAELEKKIASLAQTGA